MSNGEFDFTDFSQESGSEDDTFKLNSIGVLKKLEFITERGGFTCITLPWDVPKAKELQSNDELLCCRRGAIGELKEQMDAGWFIIGGAERPGQEAEVGVVRRGQPLLYRPVKLRLLTESQKKHKLSEEGVEHLRKLGLVRFFQGFEMYLDAPDIYATGLVKSLSIIDNDDTVEPERLL